MAKFVNVALAKQNSRQREQDSRYRKFDFLTDFGSIGKTSRQPVGIFVFDAPCEGRFRVNISSISKINPGRFQVTVFI